MRRIGVIAGALAGVLLASSCHISATIWPVVVEPSDQIDPAAAASLTVWEDYRNGDLDGADVFLSGPSGISVVAGGRGDQTNPVVSSSFVVWEDASGPIVARNLATGRNVTVVSGPGAHVNPAVCGTLVVWTDSRSGNADVYGRDLGGVINAGAEFAVSATPSVEAYPDCDGHKVAYVRVVGSSSDIYLYDIDDRRTTVVSAEWWHESHPAISGSRVAWQAVPPDTGSGTSLEVYAKDVATGAQLLTTRAAGDQKLPDISGSLMAWEDDRNGKSSIVVIDLTSGPAEYLSDQPAGDQEAPAVTGSRVVYQDRSSGNWDIYTADVVVSPL